MLTTVVAAVVAAAAVLVILLVVCLAVVVTPTVAPKTAGRLTRSQTATAMPITVTRKLVEVVRRAFSTSTTMPPSVYP